MSRRALFERSELGRPPQARVRPIFMRPDGASLVLGPFAETKGPRPPGRNPVAIMNSKNCSLRVVLEILAHFAPTQSEVKRNAYKRVKCECLMCLLRIRVRVYPSLVGRSLWPESCERPGRLL